MGKLKGIFKITGKYGDVHLYKHKHYGILVRGNVSHSKERMNNDPAFAKVKQNYNLFGEVSSLCKLIREAFMPVVEKAGDSMMNNRLISPIRKIYQQGVHHNDHPLHHDGIVMLRGFEFNKYTGFNKICTSNIKIERHDDEIAINMENLSLGHVPQATHCRIISSVAEIDFTNKKFSRTDDVSDIFKSGSLVQSIELRNESTGEYPVVMVVLSILYYELTNGCYYKFENNRGKAAKVLEVYTRF